MPHVICAFIYNSSIPMEMCIHKHIEPWKCMNTHNICTCDWDLSNLTVPLIYLFHFM